MYVILSNEERCYEEDSYDISSNMVSFGSDRSYQVTVNSKLA